MGPGDRIDDRTPKPDEIRAAVDRITSSEIFVRSPQISAFLRFVVDATLQGKGDRIKAYTIGIEVLRRDSRFDPQIDPIVRVEGSRLRRALQRYYAGPGSQDPVLVDLPRGSYVPTFQSRTAEQPSPPPDARQLAAALNAVREQPRTAAALGLAGVLLVGGLALAFLMGAPSAPAPVTSRDSDATLITSASPPRGVVPLVAVPALEVHGAPSEGGVSADTLHRKIGDAFARFGSVQLVDKPADSARLVPDYQVVGRITYRTDALTSIGFRLIDADQRVIWSHSFDRTAAGEGPDEREDAIVADLATILLRPYGVIRSRDLARTFNLDPETSRYRCILEASDATRRLSWSTQQQRAQQCLHRWIGIDPGFALAYPHLAEIYVQDFLYELEPQEPDTAPLDKALSYARRGIELAPESAHGYRVMMLTRFYRKEYTAAFSAGDRALSLNPFDRSIAAEYGTKLIQAGELETGMTMILRGVQDTQVLLPRHKFGLFIGSYLSGNMVDAVHYAKQIDDGETPYSLLATALMCIRRRETSCARTAYERLVQTQPGWRDIDRELAKHFGRPSHISKLADELMPLSQPAAN